MRNKEVVKIKVDGEEKEVWVTQPSPEVTVEAQKFYNCRWNEYGKKQPDGSYIMLRKQLPQFMKDRGIWSDEHEQEVKRLRDELVEGEIKLKSGKKGFKTLSEAKAAAFEMGKKRERIRDIYSEQNELDKHTVEALAEQDKFNFMLVKCVSYPDGEPYFADLDDYVSKIEEPNSYILAAKFAMLHANYDPDSEMKQPENKFLKSYGFVNDKGRLTRPDGKFVDGEGRLIDEEFRYVDEDGNYVDIEGRPITKDGEYIVEFEAFTDDEGNVVKPRE